MKVLSRIFVCLSVLSLLATLLIVVEWHAFVPFSWIAGPHDDFGIVLDAGSHGTRAHLYKWPARIQDPNKPFKKPVTIPEHVFVAQTTPGIGTYVYDKVDLIGEEQILPLIEQVKDELMKRKVQPDRWSSIPIGLKATAGMRDVSPDIRASAFKNIRRTLATTPFRFRETDARTISGEEEGMFGWLATNNSAHTMFAPAAETIGSLDMGGASAQIVFKPVHTSIMEDSYEVTLSEEDLRLYSHSYLGYGWGDSLGRVTARMAVEVVIGHLESLKWPEQATKNFTKDTIGLELVKLVHQDGSEPLHLSKKLDKKMRGVVPKPGEILLEAKNPCFPQGYDYMYDVPGLAYPDGRMFLDVDYSFMKEYMISLGLGVPPDVTPKIGEPIIRMDRKAAHLPVFDPVPPHEILKDPTDTRDGRDEEPFVPFDGYYGDEKTHYRIHWIGTGNFEQCRERAKALFYAQPCFTHSCSFNGIYQPRLEGSSFKGFGQYSKIADALGIPSNPSLKTLEMKVSEICSMPFDKMQAEAKAGAFKNFDDTKVHKLCWKALWSFSFLVDGLRFPSGSQSITFVASDSNEGGWAMGAMIYEVNRLPYKVVIGRFKWPFFAAFTTAVIALGSVYTLFRENAKLEKNYEALLHDTYNTA